MSKDDMTTENNMLTQINMDVNSLLLNKNNFNKGKEKEYENITMLNISDSYLVEDLDEYSRIQIKTKKFNTNLTEGKNTFSNNNNYSYTDFNNEKDASESRMHTAQNVRNVSINNITSKFDYGRNSNLVKFDGNVNNKLPSRTNTNSNNNILEKNKIGVIDVPRKIKKNRKNFNNNKNNFNYNSEYADDECFSGCLTDENQIQAKREDNTVVNLFKYLNFSDTEINCKNSNNLNFNFSGLESENAQQLQNSNYFNNNNNNFVLCEGKEFKDNSGCFQHSHNLNKISSKSFKGSLSGISKITTNNHRNKHFNFDANNASAAYNINSNDNKDCVSNLKVDSAFSNNNYYNKKKTNNNQEINYNKKTDAENKLSNISILSIKSDNSESGKCSEVKCNNNIMDDENEDDADEENNTVIINKKNFIGGKININKNTNSDVNMSYYASDVDEVFIFKY